ncbi:pyridoxamine 5'-phosphate oxidase family protein [Salinigranum rubrum]|uniref:Pyridoxamine 5'-phosphate oxidase family protein n=1 Tax=Salinigranum rubrum TaxID=755307 RepID=A0A2I8VN96_9EURY|nr:pyridoxamine 5'-phosphate oxidase family protein [Salinigranum rubrum]AUV83391.1 pyridoxamine 5'-phosphate oxidase family protein [Salinigranum rubrum]
MIRSTARALDQAGIDSFLESQSTGTLSLAKENDSYAIPVAYTYAPETRDLYFRLGYAPGSRKREYIETTDVATFVVAAPTDAGWKSVVARGRLEHRNTVEDLSRHRLPGEAVSQADRELRIPFYHVFEAPSETVFALVRLDVTELTGVVEAGTDD